MLIIWGPFEAFLIIHQKVVFLFFQNLSQQYMKKSFVRDFP